MTIDIGHLLDWMPPDAKKEFVGLAVAEGELLKILCQEIAGANINGGPMPQADVWMGSKARGEMREALSPLLGPAVAEELNLARETASKFERCRDVLRSLAHIRLMIEEATDIDERCSRNQQWREQWEEVNSLFPEYAPKPKDFSKTPAIVTSSST